MPVVSEKIQVSIDVAALRHNYKQLSAQAKEVVAAPVQGGWPRLIPIVKANAYGHGIGRVVPILLEEGVTALGITEVAEAPSIMAILEQKEKKDVRFLVLGGSIDPEMIDIAITHGMTLVGSSLAQMQLYSQRAVAAQKELGVAIKVDTGMGRLGFHLSELRQIAMAIKALPGLVVNLFMSHYASSDTPSQLANVQKQTQQFIEAHNILAPYFPEAGASISNSGGMLAGHLKALPFPTMVRSGFALYGSNPLEGTEWHSRGEGLQPVMRVSAPVIQVCDVVKGQSIGYGSTFTAPSAMKIAVIKAGYADGYSWRLANKGIIMLHGQRVPVVGRVCMQMCMVDITQLIHPVAMGDRAWLLGGDSPNAVTATEIAALWGTIPYEVYCILGNTEANR